MTLAILAGGEAKRMGYPKAEMRLGGRPILHVLLDRFAWPGPTLLVTAPGREHPTGHERFTREVVDPFPGQGPLRGLLTALENCPTPRLVLTAVDMPLVRKEQLVWLVGMLQQRVGSTGLMPCVPERDGGIQPLPAAFHSSTACAARRLLDAQRRSLQSLLDAPNMDVTDIRVDWPSDTWTNINTPEQLAHCDRACGPCESPGRTGCG